jgi:hypothetical protein
MSIEFISGLRFGALGPKTLHVCIDMQLMFASETKWSSEAIWRALPAILEISGRYASQTVFTRFICPRDLSETSGQWTRFYADAEGMLSSQHLVFSRFDQHIEVISTVELFRNWLNNL